MGKSGLFDLTGQQPILVPKSDSCWVLPEQFLGLEIEIEDFKPTQVNRLLRVSGNWIGVEDHSLRGGIELVFSQALMGQQLSEAIDEFFDNVTSYSNGPRTSIHVHVNMRQEEDTPASLRNLCVLYYMYEDAFFAFAEESRKWCSYCNPFEDSPPDVLTAVIRGDSMKDIRRLIQDASEGRTNRYYGLNLLALVRHGTVEFRHMPCVKDRERVVEWIQLIMELKYAATLMAAEGKGPFELFADIELLASLSEYMPRFGERLRDLVPDVVAYRKLGLASMYRSGNRRLESYGIHNNATFNRYVEKALGPDAVAQPSPKKKGHNLHLDSNTDRLDTVFREPVLPQRTRRNAPRFTPDADLQLSGSTQELSVTLNSLNQQQLELARTLVAAGVPVAEALDRAAETSINIPNEQRTAPRNSTPNF